MSSIENINSKDKVQTFFDTYFEKKIEVSANKVDATVGFFKERDFGNYLSSAPNFGDFVLFLDLLFLSADSVHMTTNS